MRSATMLRYSLMRVTSPSAIPRYALYTPMAAMSSGSNKNDNNTPKNNFSAKSAAATQVLRDAPLVPTPDMISQRTSGPVVRKEKKRKAGGTAERTIDEGDVFARQAFTAFSREVGCCGPDDFMKGVAQVYYSIGVFLNGLIEYKPEAIKGNAKQQRSIAAREGAEYIANEFLSEKDWSAVTVQNDKNPSSTLFNGKESDASTVENFVKAISSLLPMKPTFAEHILDTWIGHRNRSDSNLFTIASPSDYIINSELILFVPMVPAISDVYAHRRFNPLPLKMRVYPTSPMHSRHAAPVMRTTEVNGAGAPVAPTAAPAKDAHSFPPAELSPTTPSVLQFSLAGGSLIEIPDSALASAVVTMDVVVPPERYCSNFGWFYDRLTEYECDFQRIAAAHAFAQSFSVVAKALDLLSRIFSKKRVQMSLTKPVVEHFGIPKNIAECPPARRKLAIFYMDSSKRWVLADLLPVSLEMTSKIPKV